jgi:hypothetical protein
MNQYRIAGMKHAVEEGHEIDKIEKRMAKAELKRHDRAVCDSYRYDMIHADELFKLFESSLRIVAIPDRSE